MSDDYICINNPDKAHRERIIKQIKERGGYCPSKSARNSDTKCHCKEYRETGICECGLYLKLYAIDVTPDAGV